MWSQLEGQLSGFFERTEDERWEPFIPFNSLPNLDGMIPI